MEIEKGRPVRVFAGGGEEWRTLELRESFKVVEALADPTRQWIYQILEQGPLRQAELAKKASDHFKKKITNVLMRYHLQKLSEAGLVKFDRNAGERVKLVYRASELRIQLRQPVPVGGPEVLAGELMKVFRRG